MCKLRILFHCFFKFDELFKVLGPPLTLLFQFIQRCLFIKMLAHLRQCVSAEIPGCAVFVADNRCYVSTISLTVVLHPYKYVCIIFISCVDSLIH